MSYIVFARKYRPVRFSEVVGQPHVTRTIINGLLQKRLAHAYLLSGPRGVGKTTTARLLARAVNCAHPVEGEPCGVCPSCEAIGEGRALDVIEIDAASNRGIDEIRALRDTINYAPIEGKSKIYIIDEVHMLTDPAFNALLKTLEEPPEHAYFCLATTAPQKVPATILSRCQRFDFRRVSLTEIAGHLESILEKEAIPYEELALDVIARKADGSIRDSLSLLDQIIAFSGGTVMRQDAVDVAGDIRLDLYFRALQLIDTHSLSDAFDLDSELSLNGVDPQDYLVGLEEQIIKLLEVKAMGPDKADISRDLKSDYAKMAERVNESELVRVLQLCSVAETDVRRNFNPRIRLQLLLVKLATLERSVVLADLIARLEKGLPATPAAAPVPPPARPAPVQRQAPAIARPAPAAVAPPAAPAKPAVAPPLPSADDAEMLQRAQAAWNDLCDRIADKHNSRARLIKHGGYPVAYSAGTLRINFSSQSHLDTARALTPALKEEFTPILGPVTFDMQVGPTPQSEASAPSEPDPAAKLLMDRFGARQI